jgi:hypothetical protein
MAVVLGPEGEDYVLPTRGEREKMSRFRKPPRPGQAWGRRYHCIRTWNSRAWQAGERIDFSGQGVPAAIGWQGEGPLHLVFFMLFSI